ncbi:MAG: hypothetical protein AAGC57_00645 [Pseudomonadota bacterium]
MRRALLAVLAAGALALIGAVIWFVVPRSPAEARFAHEECRRLPLTDARTGAVLAGIEDIAPYASDLFLSVQDRAAAEAAAVEGRTPPQGGLYRLPLADLDRPGPLELVAQTPAMATPLHPHGIHASLAKLVAINRRYGPDGAEGRELLVFAIREDRLKPLRRLPNSALCAANDLLLTGRTVRLTLDRAACPGIDPWEQARGGATGRLAMMGASDSASGGLRVMADALTYPNGVAMIDGAEGRRLLVAETRGDALVVFGDPLRPMQIGAPLGRLTLPGGPDNLTVAPDGRAVAALHPSLIRLALYRFGWAGHAPSRLVAVDDQGATEWLFDDPPGALFSGASVGVLTESGHLVAGSVRDAGLLVCGPAR